MTQKNTKHQPNIRPNKSFGQNFLTDKNFLAKIVSAGDLQSDDTVLEIGAGTGVLTVELAKRVKRVVAYEIDKKLIRVLQENLAEYKNVEIINEDILGKSGVTPPGNFKLIANIPYNITSKILERFLSAKNKPSLIVLLVQKEVAERVVNKEKMSVLSVMVQFYGQPSIVAKVPAGAFWPAPKVDSAILKILDIKDINEIDEQAFFHLVKAGFVNKRKMLKNNLKEYGTPRVLAALRELGLKDSVRAEELSVKNWVLLNSKLQRTP